MNTEGSNELRLESRNNIFVMAALYTETGSSTPVRVRNMSRSGALVEAASLPPVGTHVRLSRGSLNASGDVMWVGDGKAGLRFRAPVAVREWLPQGRRGSGQQLIDELVHQKRRGATLAAANVQTPQAATASAEEIEQLHHLLERAAEELALDAAVASRHALALQMIDGVAQTLARLAASAAVANSAISAVARA